MIPVFDIKAYRITLGKECPDLLAFWPVTLRPGFSGLLTLTCQ